MSGNLEALKKVAGLHPVKSGKTARKHRIRVPQHGYREEQDGYTYIMNVISNLFLLSSGWSVDTPSQNEELCEVSGKVL